MEQPLFAITGCTVNRLRISTLFSVAAGLILMLSAPRWVLAAAAPCEIPPAQAEVRFGYQRGAAEPFRDSGTVALRRTHASIDTGPSDTHVRWRFAHDYSVYDIDLGTASAQPSGNGHLHRLALDADFSSLLRADWHLRLQPALAVSSNQLKSPDSISSRGLQLNAALLRHVATGPDTGWTAGLCADQRFGEHRIYPSVSWQWTANDWFLQLGWPDSRLTKQLNTVLHTSVRISPGGNRWHVLGQGTHHWFSHDAWQISWALEWRPMPALGLELSTTRLFDNRLAFTLEDGSSFGGRTDAPQQWGLSLIWYLEQPFSER